jgi:hypothetical protein
VVVVCEAVVSVAACCYAAELGGSGVEDGGRREAAALQFAHGARLVPVMMSPRSTPVVSTASATTPMPVCPPVMVFESVLPVPSWMTMPKYRLSERTLSEIRQQPGLDS